MADELPDRLSTNPDSPYYNAALLERDIGVRFKGVEKTNVEEYCVSEGWVRVSVGKGKDRDLRQVDLLLARQRQQQVERTFIALDIDHQRRLAFSDVGRPPRLEL